MTNYYALYDLQLHGFKATYASSNYEILLSLAADRAYDLSQGDEEPCPEHLSDQEILELYDYEIKEVTKEVHDIILESDEIGLTRIVTFQ